MNIVFAGTLPPHQGGTAIMAYQLLNSLSVLGHRVRAIAPLASDDWGTEPLAGEIVPGVAILRFEMPYLETNTFAGASQDYRNRQTAQVRVLLEAACRDQCPDLILVGRSSFIWGVPDFAHSIDIPVVLWEHQSSDAVEHRDRTMFHGALLPELRKSDRIVVCSEHTQAGFGRLGLTQVRSAVNSVDTGLFAPEPRDDALRASLSIGADNSVAIHVSNLKPVKRPLDIVRCAAMLRDRCPHLRWLIVGEGTCREDMAAEAAKSDVADRLRFVDWVSHREVERYLNLADLAVVPSETEGLALAYLESMACAVPVVASDISAAREAIVEAETGMFHDVGDVDAMAARVEELVQDPSRREAMGRRARHRAEACFEFSAYAGRWNDILRELVDERQSAGRTAAE